MPSLRPPARETIFRPFPLASPVDRLVVHQENFLPSTHITNMFTMSISIDPNIPTIRRSHTSQGCDVVRINTRLEEGVPEVQPKLRFQRPTVKWVVADCRSITKSE